MTTLITGATGSYGSALAKHLLATTSEKLRLLGRSESRLAGLQRELDSPRATYILCDIRDYDRLLDAFKGVDTVYHAAALKVVGMSYVHTSEFVKTNIDGTRNVVRAAIRSGVGRVLNISSDKACEPFNPYGASKAMAEHIVTESNLHTPYATRLASVRGGNVWGSRGSVMERWTQEPTIVVADPEITRFHLPMQDWLKFCVRVVDEMRGGEVFTPKCRAWRLGTLAGAFQEHFNKPVAITGIAGDGDKQHESLVSSHEARTTVDLGWTVVIEPSSSIRDVWRYESHAGRAVTGEVSSDKAPRLTIDELRSAIKNNG